jgi:hypothetical protein
MGNRNPLVWSGQPGHYEVYYLTLTDPATGIGCWIRYTMLAPNADRAEPATAALWFLAMDPRPGRTPTFGRKQTFAIETLEHHAEPFQLSIGEATLTDTSLTGSVEGASWDLRYAPCQHAYTHVHPMLERAKLAQTMLTLPHGDLSIDGTIELAGETIELSGARGGQAHLWGSKHARNWAWVHCNDFRTEAGEDAAGTLIDAVSVVVSRLGRDVGPSTPVVGRFDGEDFASTAPIRVIRNKSSFAPTTWHFEAEAGRRRLVCDVSADRRLLAGVTYHDPDGELAYCYNSEVASMRVEVHDRAGRGWVQRETLIADGRAHFEYAQRTPLPGLELLTT